MEKSTQNSTFLKIMAIVLLVFGIIGVAAYAFVIVATSAFNSLLGDLGAIPMTGFVMSVVQGVLMVVAGVFGIAGSKNPEKAKVCMIIGIILTAFAVVSMIMVVMQTGPIKEFAESLGTSLDTPIWSNVTSIAFPALYFLAAFLFKKKAA